MQTPDASVFSAGATAIHLATAARAAGDRGLLYVAADDPRAEQVEDAVRALFPDLEVLAFPAWDCLPYDRVSPSRAVQGVRASTLRRLASEPSRARLVVTTVAAAAQRVPGRGCWDARTAWTLGVGAPVDLDALHRFLRATGHVLDDRVDEAGEAAIRGGVVEVFPAAGALPVRADHADGVILRIRTYDPATQRTIADLRELRIEPASEVVLPDDVPREPGIEQRLPVLVDGLETLFDYLPGADLALDPGLDELRADRDALVTEAFEARSALRGAGRPPPIPPRDLYLDDADWQAAVAGRTRIPAEADVEATEPVGPGASRGVRALLAAALADAERVLLVGPTERDLRRLVRAVGRPVVPVGGWDEGVASPPGSVLALVAPLDGGFARDGVRVVVASRSPDAGRRAAEDPLGAAPLRPGDLVVHLDHGLGSLLDFERIRAATTETDCVRLGFASDATLLVPAEDMPKLWRYGSEEAGVPLDRLNGRAWARRREQIEAEIEASAEELVALARQREAAEAPALVPPRAEMKRFVRRFPYPETPDQVSAIEAVLEDLASGRPMDRLICGEVGFGKTEVACGPALRRRWRGSRSRSRSRRRCSPASTSRRSGGGSRGSTCGWSCSRAWRRRARRPPCAPASPTAASGW